MKVLFLYTELADYFIHCCKNLSKQAEVHIIRWPVNKEAPFEFEIPPGIKVYNKNEYNAQQLEQLVNSINPDLIVCSGWIDKDYLSLVKPYFGKIPTVLACDTHWKGTLKQYAAIILSRFFLKNRFSHVWVPGQPQFDYVKKLGFRKNRIKTGFYCCDLEKFNTIYSKTSVLKKNAFPKKFLYVGRYYDFKGITDLWQAFTELCEETRTDWELWCLGNGNIEPIKHPNIKHFGFVQPKDLSPIIENAGVFVLPSRFEPWAVVVQEYAAAGFPLLLSKEVGALEAFLDEGKNGYSFHKENVTEIKNSLKKIISLENGTLVNMSEHSHQLAQKINPDIWSNTISEIYAEFREN
jgi:glycosyltransferase involved in cell wall biosynthesis